MISWFSTLITLRNNKSALYFGFIQYDWVRFH